MKKHHLKWVMRTALMTFLLAVLFSLIAEAIMRHVNVVAAFLLLLLIIFIGVFFDAIGIAVAAADEKPFHAMASARIKSAKYSLRLIKNAPKVSNFCNDVVGDIAGIISGTAIGIIIGFLSGSEWTVVQQTYFSIIFSGSVAALTVGGKALGKEFAISKSKEVVDFTGRVIYAFYRGFAFLGKRGD
jgi:CBS domain containing-hemolysin-like protein